MARAQPAAWPKAKDAVEKLSMGAKSGGQPARRMSSRVEPARSSLELFRSSSTGPTPPILIIDGPASPHSSESWVFVELSWTDALPKALPASWADAAPHASAIRVRDGRPRRG